MHSKNCNRNCEDYDFDDPCIDCPVRLHARQGPKGMKVLICGGRNFNQYGLLSSRLNELHNINRFTMICHGGARGADTLAGSWAFANKIPVQVYNAQWNTYGRRAGGIRNQLMLDDFKPDMVIAFPGGHGTDNMVRKALYAKVPVIRIHYDQ
jgi:hypothetical protein